MITKDNERFVLNIEDNILYFDGDEYEDTLLYLTNPNITLPTEVTIDTKIEDEDDKYIMNTYKDFVNSFINKRNATDLLFMKEENSSENNDNE